jgi:hypothetical protein
MLSGILYEMLAGILYKILLPSFNFDQIRQESFLKFCDPKGVPLTVLEMTNPFLCDKFRRFYPNAAYLIVPVANTIKVAIPARK